MFSGIIQSQGKIIKIKKYDNFCNIEVHSNLVGYNLGSSIACSGICLTVTSKSQKKFTADLSYETLSKTNAKYWVLGKKINLENSLRIGDEVSGHFVFGHVDSTCQLVSKSKVGKSWVLVFKFPVNLKKFITKKGSVAINGISLTVNRVTRNTFECTIIPHTYKNTDIHTYNENEIINLEVDMLARYAHYSKK